MHKALLLTNGLLQGDKEARGVATKEFGNGDHQYHAQQKDERQIQTVIQHDKEHADNDNACANERGERLPYQLTERVDIVGVTAHNVAVLVGVKILDGQVLHFCKQCLTHLAQKALRNARHQLRFQCDGNDGNGIKADQNTNLGDDVVLSFLPRHAVLPRVGNRVGNFLEEDCGNGRGHGTEDDANNRNGKQNGIIFKQHFDQAFEHSHVQFTLGRTHHRGKARFGRDVRLLHLCHLRSFVAPRPRDRSRWLQGAPRACPFARSCRSP